MAVYAWKRYSLKPGYINVESEIGDYYLADFCGNSYGGEKLYTMYPRYYEDGPYLWFIDDIKSPNEYYEHDYINSYLNKDCYFNSKYPYVRYIDSSGGDDCTKLYKIVLNDGDLMNKYSVIKARIISRVPSKVKDKNIDIVKSEASLKYPKNGIQDNYWYEFIGKVADTKLKETGEYDIMRTNIKIGGGQ